MRKLTATICMIVCLLTSCSTARLTGKIVLPEAKDICAVTIINGSSSMTTEDTGYITELLQGMGTARDTGRASIQDRPAGSGVLQVDFEFRQGGVSTVFLYREGNMVMLEQPYQGIFEANGTLLDFLWE